MVVHRIKKGLDLPLGPPPNALSDTPSVTTVALLGDDFPGVKPRMHVVEGDTVKRGQLLFEDRKNPAARLTSPGAGRVKAIHRGARRALISVVIELDEAERAGKEPACETFASFTGRDVDGLTQDEVRALLQESGMWASLRTRPFSKVPPHDLEPHALFITAIDTAPLAPDPIPIIEARRDDFRAGLTALAKLCPKRTYLCIAEGASLSEPGAPVRVEAFSGPHPAGLVGVHMHRLAPVSRERVAFSIGYQDVLSVGALFRTGVLDVERVVSIAGPSIARPRLVRTRVGASIEGLTQADALAADVRLISGSVLSGKAVTRPELAYLGRFERQITALAEGRERELLGWLAPGMNAYSVLPVFLSRWLRRAPRFSTSTHGGRRAIVPIGVYERVMPMDILPTHLFRALAVGDLERAEALGCLELDEEDVALCTFVCPSKIDFGPLLRKNLALLEAA